MNLRLVNLVLCVIIRVSSFKDKVVGVDRSAGSRVSGVGVTSIVNLSLFKKEGDVIWELEFLGDASGCLGGSVEGQDLGQVGCSC